MKTLCLIVLLIALSLPGIAQHKSDAYPDIPHLNGSVKYLEEAKDSDAYRKAEPRDLLPYLERYTFDEKERCTSHIKYYRKAAPLTIQLSYNDEDRSEVITTFTEKYPDKISSRTLSRYRADGSLLSQEVRLSGASAHSLKFDEKGNPIAITDTVLNVRRKTASTGSGQPSIRKEVWKNTYNSLGQLSERSFFKQDTLWSKENFKYDANGNEIFRETITVAGYMTSRTISVYDDHNRRIEHRYFAPKEISHSKTTYNKYNDPIRVVYYKPSGEISSQYDSKYRYDNQHNWIERRTSFKIESYKVTKDSVDGMLDQKPAVRTGSYLTKRIIQYY